MSKSDFTDILKPHYNDGVNYCRALCSGSSISEAEDVMQQSLLKAYENIDSLKDKRSFRSWFFQIITRTFYNSVRKPFWSRFVSLESESGKVAFQVFEDDFFEDNQWIVSALSKISKKERATILLYEIGGFSIKEIASMQGENSESTIKSRLSRTRNKLKEIMEDLDTEQGDKNSQPRSIKQQSNNDLYHETSRIIKEIKSIG